MNLVIHTYAATDPENTPPKLRGMARAVLNGELALVVAYEETPEGAGEKLRVFYEAELARIAGLKRRGRPKKKVEGMPIRFTPTDTSCSIWVMGQVAP